MKKALLHSIEVGRVCEVVEAGQEFEVAKDFTWIDCPDDVTSSHTYDETTETFKAFDILTTPGFAENAYKVARSIAYTDVGNQLDMLYKEIQATGSISVDGPWVTHVTEVKTNIPKDDPAAVLAWNIAQAQLLDPNI
tara:strand:- start:101 stop:511 length:411 start_codon:yes stop_codon:yes gene_type:complete